MRAGRPQPDSWDISLQLSAASICVKYHDPFINFAMIMNNTEKEGCWALVFKNK